MFSRLVFTLLHTFFLAKYQKLLSLSRTVRKPDKTMGANSTM